MRKRVQDLAVFLSYITLAGAIALIIMAFAIWLFWDHLAPYAAGNLKYSFNLSGLTIGERFIGFAISFLGAVIQAYGLLGLRHTFSEAAQGNPLSEKAVRGFRRFAWVTLIMVLIGILQRTGLIVLFSLSDAAHEGTLSIQLGSNELKAAFLGLLLVFVAQIFMEGKRVKEENEAFI